MSGFGKKFEDIMSAIAFAEAGEPAAAREILRKKKVLLVLTGACSDAKSFGYAMNTAKRIGAALEVLYIGSGAADDPEFPDSFERQMRQNGIEFSVAREKGCLRERLLDFIGKRRDILFVVAESQNILNSGCDEEAKLLRGAWRKLGCPLVLVSEAQAGS